MMTPDEAAEELNGTARSFEEIVGASIVDMPIEWLAHFDELVMCCEICGWWSDAADMNDEQTCIECEANE